MVLAFRLYGHFHWPPHPKIENFSTEIRSGTVEIHYQEKITGSGDFRPLLRWVPRAASAASDAFPVIHNSIFDFTVAEAVKWFDDNTDKDCAIWIDAGDHDEDTDWVAFRGAFLIDQYRAPTPLDEAELDLRWPLVRACEYAAGRRAFSSLDVGRRGGPRYCLNLNLPLPARRSTLPDDHPDPAAFPFSAVFEPGDEKFKEIRQFTTLVGGWIEGDAVDTSAVDPPLTSFVFRDDKYPPGATLGTFGFAARGKPAQGGFAIYSGEQKPRITKTGKKKPVNIDARKFWPADASPFTVDMLQRYGFSLAPGSTKRLGVKAGETTADLSLRFARVDNQPTRPAFIYRIAVLAGAGAPAPADDLKNRNGRLGLRLIEETGGWVATAETLYVDCKLSFDIADGDIWSPAPDRWAPKIDLCLHWQDEIPAGKTLGNDLKNGADLDLGLLRHADHSFRQARKALYSVEAGQPRSLLPDLRADGKQTVRFAIHGASLAARFAGADKGKIPSGLLNWGKPATVDGTDIPFIRPRMRLTLAEPGDLIATSEDINGLTHGNDLHLIASAQSFFTTAKASPEIGLILSRDAAWADARQEQIADGEPFFASYLMTVNRTKQPWTGRLSSLKFAWSPGDDDGGGSPGGATATYLRAGGPCNRQGMAGGAPPIVISENRIAASIHLVLEVSHVAPVGVDVHRLDRSQRVAPLIIPASAAATDASGLNYWLSVTESIGPTYDRWIEADIYENAADTGAQSYVVLSEEPFSIFRYTQPPLGDRGDIGSASVAYYSGDDRIWQYRKVADHYHYSLPPQAVGESADKPRRLEIHDLGTPNEKDPAHAWRPYVREIDADGVDRTGDGLKRRAVEFRLTPSTEIWIRPSDVERGYFKPEQASHEIFRQRGEYGLGAALAFLRGEFLYGLSVGVDVSKETSVAGQARVAEIEALTGSMSGPSRYAVTPFEADLKTRWNALSRAVARRPERLEIWARDPNSAMDFTPARFSGGVSYALRGTALARPPLEKLEEAGDHGRWPKVGERKPSPDDTDSERKAGLQKPRSHPQGLSGGALWPVESTNLFNHLVKNPDSVGGTIESIALSPIGGDAVQKAAFLNGVVTIISETRNGHIERQKVEVLGRVGAFWHRAKHVVVYERTVNASAQFAPKHAEDLQRTRSRRPILRKVREYVELLEHERRYPDMPTATPRSCGCLDRVRFNSRIINVDSAWSTEVGDFGWKIPLWNLNSARERPQVYPMPDIAFVTTAEGEEERPLVAQECIDTDNLFFYADFTGGGDTNVWACRLNIDYADMPAAKAIADEADRKSAGAKEGRRRAVSRQLPGLRRFTWRLAPAARKTAINSGRSSKPVYVGLDSISFMRAAPTTEGKELPEHLKEVLQNAAHLPQPTTEPKEIVALAYWTADGKGSDLAEAGPYAEAVDQLVKGLAAKNRPAVEAALAILGDRWATQDLPGKIKAKLGAAAAEAAPILKDLKGLDGKFGDTEKLCERLKNDAIGMIKRKEMLLCTALSDWTADIARNFPTLEIKNPPGPGTTKTSITTKTQAIAEISRRVVAHLRPIFDEAGADVGKAGESVEKARTILMAAEVEIEAVFARAGERIEQFSSGYDREKPWSAERYKSFRSGLRASIANVTDDIDAVADEARQRFASELSALGQSIGGHLAKALTAIAAAGQNALHDIATVQNSLGPLLAPLTAAVEAMAGDIDGAIAGIATVQADINGATGISDALRKQAGNLLASLAQAATLGKTLLAETAAWLAQSKGTGDDHLGEVGTGVAGLAASASALVEALANRADGLAVLAAAFAAEGHAAIAAALDTVWQGIDKHVQSLSDWLEKKLLEIGEPADFIVSSSVARLQAVKALLLKETRSAHGTIDAMAGDLQAALGAVQDGLGPGKLLDSVVRTQVIEPALRELLDPVDEDLTKVDDALQAIHARLQELSASASTLLGKLTIAALDPLDAVSEICGQLFEGANEAGAYLHGIAEDFGSYLDTEIAALEIRYGTLVGDIKAQLGDLEKAATSLINAVKAFDHSVRGLQNDLSRSLETARMYGDRVFDAVGRLGEGGIMAQASHILNLYSAVSSAPELAALKADIDRIRSGFDELTDIIETTEAGALFNRLGDELKALGLTLPFDKIADRLVPADLTRFDIGKIFGNFGGINLDSLFKGYKMPAGMTDAVRITHDFDKAAARAWVQVDIDAPMPGRRTLFSLGVFQVDFVDMALTGRVRLEVSKDQQNPTQTGFGRIGTTIDVVVGGQSMVKFEKFALNFTREKGLKVEFDPKNIHLNPSFKFIQDFLANLFPDEAGGLKIVKRDNIPVGVEHEFAIPPMTLNFGTSGVTNISIENHFKLLAFPDFMIANRFNLSTLERPFIFSIFIIGGTGYVQIDAEYRPFDSQLMVSVEAGAGGSAALAFAVGPFVGQVFITLSGVMTYRKMIGKPGGGLSLAVVLVIAGQVEVCGIVSVGITLTLRLSYRDNGEIDAQGSLAVTIRISRFFKIRAHANVTYKLRGGKSETSVNTGVSGEIDDDKLKKKVEYAEQAVKQLQKASA